MSKFGLARSGLAFCWPPSQGTRVRLAGRLPLLSAASAHLGCVTPVHSSHVTQRATNRMGFGASDTRHHNSVSSAASCLGHHPSMGQDKPRSEAARRHPGGWSPGREHRPHAQPLPHEPRPPRRLGGATTRARVPSGR
jgi:hypothetical protein